jgi:hypothetical protein
MIGQHPELAGLPELKLFAYDTIGELEASLPSYWAVRGFTHRSPGLVRAVAQLAFGNQSVDGFSCAREWLRERAHWSGADVCDFLLGRLKPRAGVEKSPENVESEDALARLGAAYPRARYLHLTRHPVTTQRSLEEHLRRTVPEFSVPGQPMSGMAYWTETNLRILSFTALRPRYASLRVRAEDVLNDSDTQLRRIAGWLGIRDDDSALEAMRHPEASRFARPGISGSGIIGGFDPDFLRNPVLRSVTVPTRLERPSAWTGHSVLWDTTVDLAAQLGYR